MTLIELKISKLTKQYNSRVHNPDLWSNNEDLEEIKNELIKSLEELNQCPFIPITVTESLTVESYYKKLNDERSKENKRIITPHTCKPSGKAT